MKFIMKGFLYSFFSKSLLYMKLNWMLYNFKVIFLCGILILFVLCGIVGCMGCVVFLFIEGVMRFWVIFWVKFEVVVEGVIFEVVKFEDVVVEVVKFEEEVMKVEYWDFVVLFYLGFKIIGWDE